MSDEQFVKEYEKLLDKDYCNCNEMNCIDNNAPRRILNIVQKLMIKNRELDSNNRLLIQQLKDCEKENSKLKRKIKELEQDDVIDGQVTIDDFIE